ncbi:MAG: KTSC domain containing protein [Desulfuromonas sp. SDB]|nr:MAG: KTSC domain containing protein [Desulfuromonas sp. SDB]
MEMIQVKSSNLAAVGYDPNSAVLKVEFLNCRIYEYYDVPQYIFDELLAADSKGKYAASNIYKNYNQQRIL